MIEELKAKLQRLETQVTGIGEPVMLTQTLRKDHLNREIEKVKEEIEKLETAEEKKAAQAKLAEEEKQFEEPIEDQNIPEPEPEPESDLPPPIPTEPMTPEVRETEPDPVINQN